MKSMSKDAVRNSDIHWMPQTNFMVYEDYDDYFALEDFATATKVLKDKIGLELVDARPLTQHGSDGYRKLSKRKPYTRSPLELLEYKSQGFLPSIKTMYSDELVACVKKAYRADIALYKKKIGADTLFTS